MVRVLVISEMFPTPADAVRGSFVLSECEAMSGHGVRFQVLSPVPFSPRVFWRNAKWRRYGQVPHQARWGSIPARYPRYVRVPGAFYRKLEPFAMLPSFYGSFRKRHGEKPFDLIHAHGLLPCGMAALLLSKMFRLPCVCHARGSDVNVYPWESRANFLLTRHVIENCDAPAAVSKALADKMLLISRIPRPIEVLYSTVDTELFAPAADKAGVRRLLGIHPESFVVIYVGHLSLQKGIADLAEAWKYVAEKLPSSLLVVVGDGPHSGALGALGRRVLLCGKRPHAEVASWMQAGDLLVLPSYNEGLPTAVLEAMACELPVVATSVGGIPEAVIHRQTGFLIPPGARGRLASSILSLAQDERRRHAMGKAGRTRIEALFRPDRYISRVSELYSSVVRQRPNRRRPRAVQEAEPGGPGYGDVL